MVQCKFLMLFYILLFWGILNVNGQCGSTNIIAGKTVTTSANSGGNVGNNITDGVHPTIWQPIYNSNNYAYIDLGSQQTVCRVAVKWRYYQAASNFKIQMTNTPATESSWGDIANVGTNNQMTEETSGAYSNWVQVTTVDIAATSNNGKQYIRLWVGYIEYASWIVSELEVYKPNSNSTPSCSFVSPTTNITIAANTPLLLKANASDVDGTISEVGFYSGATSTTITTLLSDPPQTVAPYEYTWIPTVPGTYYIQAKAKDNNEAIGLSASVMVTVTAVTGGWSLSGNTVSDAELPNTFIGTSNAQDLVIRTGSLERLRITKTGKMVIGTSGLPTGAPADALLAVKGQIWARVLKVTQLNWPDYVFEKNYDLMTLPELATFIRKYKHLPGVPSVKEVTKGGINVGDNQAMLLKKIEELTLYLLEQNKKIDMLLKKSDDQQMEIEKLKKK